MRKIVMTMALAFSAMAAVAQVDSGEVSRGRGDNYHDRYDRRDHHDHHGRHVCLDPIATKEQMDDVVSFLKKQSFDDEKLAAAKLCVGLVPIPTIGLLRMAKQFSFDKARLEFVKYAYDYCPDRESYYILRDCFDFKKDVDKAFKAMGVESIDD